MLKGFHAADEVILRSSLTKDVAPGYRVGWMASGRHFEEGADPLKFHTSVSGALLNQDVLAELMRDGGQDHQVRAPREHIGLAPGSTVSCTGRFDHFIRIHYGELFSARLDTHLRRLGQIVAALAAAG